MKELPRFGKHLTLARVQPLLKQAADFSQQLVKRKDELKEGMPSAKLKELIELYENVSRASMLGGEITHAIFSVDSRNEKARDMLQLVQQQSTQISTDLLFFTLTLKAWKPASLEKYAKELPRYSSWLHDIVKSAPYTKSEAEERIIVLKDQSGASILEKIYSLTTSEFTYKLKYKGKNLVLTRGELQAYYSHPDRAVRKAAAEALLVPFKANNAVISEIYHAIATDYDTETVTIRGFKEPIDSRHLGNDISAKTFEALHASYRKNIDVFRRYTKVKQKLLKYKDFTRYDFMAPVKGAPEKITYEKSYATVIEAFDAFAPWMGQFARDVFEKENVDVPPKQGKRDGACCYPLVPGDMPLIILNFSGKYDDMFTMAHELGHAIHDLCSEDLSPLTFSPPLVLAESASTFAETVLFHHVLKKLKGQEAIAMICQRMDDNLATIVSQMRYTAFEKKAHEHIKNGGSVGDLDKFWVEFIKADFPDVEFPESSVQWSAIPHFFASPFYCYSYAFGLLLVHALWKRYEVEGKAFIPKYKAILSAGGSVPPEALLAKYGFDVTKQQFWDDGFAAIGELVSELEKRAKN